MEKMMRRLLRFMFFLQEKVERDSGRMRSKQAGLQIKPMPVPAYLPLAETP